MSMAENNAVYEKVLAHSIKVKILNTRSGENKDTRSSHFKKVGIMPYYHCTKSPDPNVKIALSCSVCVCCLFERKGSRINGISC